jgi:tricorn protease
MKIFALTLFILYVAHLPAQVYFTSHPCLSPDAREIIFTYEGDLWTVAAEGGQAYRLTAMEGDETRARISPDGNWLAFSGAQDGNTNVYIMPLGGGEIRQLSFHDGYDLVDSWSWDSRFIYFTSNRYNSFSVYKVPTTGGTPQRLFRNYFNTIHNVWENPADQAYYFTDTWESLFFANRKRYKGAYNPDIKSYNMQNGEFKVHTTYNGKDFAQTFDSQGSLYFISDEANGEYNLYTLDAGVKKQLTSFETSIYDPQVNANGEKIVFIRDYQLFLYDVNSGESNPVMLNIPKNNVLHLEKEFNVKAKITDFDVSPDGKKIVFSSRGELFVCDIKGKYVRRMQTHPQGRVMEVRWLDDNTNLIYNQCLNGYYNLFKISAKEEKNEQQLTQDEHKNHHISLNDDHTLAVYVSGRNQLKILDLKSLKSQVVVEDELWGFRTDDPQFSPDSRYIVFSAFRNFEKDLMVYDRTKKTFINLTNTGLTEEDGFFSSDGKYLYFAADRTKPSYPRGTHNMKIYRLPLTRFDTEFRSDSYNRLFVKEDKKEDDDKKEKDKKKKVKVDVKIDFDDILLRWEKVSPDGGQQFMPHVFQKDKKTNVFYSSNHDGDKYHLWKTVYEPFEETKTEKIAEAETYRVHIVEADDKLYALADGNIHELKADDNKMDKIDITFSFTRNLRDEFDQMFYETWTSLQENYYDENFHGVDWMAMKQRYTEYLPHVSSRENLRALINDMLGELNSSHQGFRSTGDEEKTYYKLRSQQTGVVFEQDNPYTVKAVVKNSAAAKEGKDIKAGDVLISVDGQTVDQSTNREAYFLKPSLDEELMLTFRRGSKELKVKIHPQSSSSLKGNLYDEWIDEKQRLTDQLGSGRIAYVQMKNMGTGSLNRFLIEMTAEANQREALILDLRNNTGGNVHDDVLRFLSQRPYAQWKYRGGQFAPQPHFFPASKPIVLLINEQSLSDAEMTAAGFKELKLGTIIGTETYRWLIFTTGIGLVDGSYHRMPSWGCYTLAGEDIEFSGVAPDIFVKNTFKDRIDGNDPQLERAVQEILTQLKTRVK